MGSIGNDVFDGLGHPGCEGLPLLTQYVEGSSYNKAIEIANLGSTAIDLSAYSIEVYSNANTTAGVTIALGGTLAPNDVYVVADDGRGSAILAVADQTTTASLWNGNDSIVLTGASGVVDSLGKIGENVYWSSNGVTTQDNTLCRIDTITSGDTNPNDAFDPSVEWEAIGNDVFYGLGEVGCEAPITEVTKIHEIQGSGSASPLVGSLVTIEGVVVGDFQDAGLGANGDFNGFFVQEEDSDGDADAATSEGILVFDGYEPTVNVAVGDLVRVTGDVAEYYDMTEIRNVTYVKCIRHWLRNAGNNRAAVGKRNRAGAVRRHAHHCPAALYISEYFNFGRYGEIVLTSDRQMQPTAVFDPGSVDAAGLATDERPGAHHARRRSHNTEPRSGHSPEWVRVHTRQSVPWWRHRPECDRRHQLQLRPVSHSTDPGRRLRIG